MGWSCARDAGCRLDAISAECLLCSKMTNQWTTKGDTYFYEVGREQRDGSITGTIFLHLPDGKCRKSGSFKINPDGSWCRGPAWMRKVPFKLVKMTTSSGSNWVFLYPGELTDAGLMSYMLEWVASFKEDGPNRMLEGAIPYPVEAEITDPDTKSVLVKWKQPMFFVWESSDVTVR